MVLVSCGLLKSSVDQRHPKKRETLKGGTTCKGQMLQMETISASFLQVKRMSVQEHNTFVNICKLYSCQNKYFHILLGALRSGEGNWLSYSVTRLTEHLMWSWDTARDCFKFWGTLNYSMQIAITQYNLSPFSRIFSTNQIFDKIPSHNQINS